MNDPQIQRIDGREALLAAACQVIAEAQRELWIASQQLEPALFMQAALIEALKSQLLTQRRLQVRLLISDARPAREHGDRLIELLRRLPSQFRIHQPSRPEHAFEHELWLADRRAFLKRESARAREASFGLHAPLDTHQLKDEYEQAWQLSSPSAEFRQMS